MNLLDGRIVRNDVEMPQREGKPRCTDDWERPEQGGSGENAKSVKGRGRALNSKSVEVWGGHQGRWEH